MALKEGRLWGILASGQPETMQAWGTIGTYEAREEANLIPQDSSPLNDACNMGGLLATVIHNGPNAGVYFPVDDGNGNVMGYVRGADGLLAAQYEYGPFGELLRATGPLSQTFNPLFSTKYLDWETGLYYYGYRYYSPTSGRWPSRDPLEEGGGLNLYGFNFNDPFNRVDTEGRASINTPAGQQVLYQELLETIASNMNMPIQQVIRRISLCQGIYETYKALQCKGCRGWGCLTKAEAAKRAACLAKEIGLRVTYLRLKCDYLLPGSVTIGSAAKEKAHQGELIHKTAAMAECTERAAQ